MSMLLIKQITNEFADGIDNIISSLDSTGWC